VYNVANCFWYVDIFTVAMSVATSAVECILRLVSKVTYNVLSEMLN